MTTPLTPLQEFMASRAAEIEAGAKLPGGEGAMHRLMQRMDTVQVTDWIADEVKRGTKQEEIADALGNYIANLMAPLCVPKGPACWQAAGFVLMSAARAFAGMVSVEYGVDAMLVNRKDGRQIMTTTADVAKTGLPK